MSANQLPPRLPRQSMFRLQLRQQFTALFKRSAHHFLSGPDVPFPSVLLTCFHSQFAVGKNPSVHSDDINVACFRYLSNPDRGKKRVFLKNHITYLHILGRSGERRVCFSRLTDLTDGTDLTDDGAKDDVMTREAKESCLPFFRRAISSLFCPSCPSSPSSPSTAMFRIQRNEFAFDDGIFNDLLHGFSGQDECAIPSILTDRVAADPEHGPLDRHASTLIFISIFSKTPFEMSAGRFYITRRKRFDVTRILHC